MRRYGVNGDEAFQEANEAYIRNLEAAVKQRRNEMKASWGKVDEGWTALRKRMVEVGCRLPDPTADSMLHLNVGGEPVDLWRSSLNSYGKVQESRLGALFSVEWDKRIPKASDGRVMLDESSLSFKHLTNLLLAKEGSPIGKSSSLATNLSGLEVVDPCHISYMAYLEDFLGLNVLHPEGGMTVREGSRVLSGRGRETMLRLLKIWVGNESANHMKLLYRASRDGFTPTSFHEKCNDAKSSLTLIKVQRPSDPVGSIVGGYSSTSWAPPAFSATNFKHSPGAFIFLLQDGSGGASPLKWHEDADGKPGKFHAGNSASCSSTNRSPFSYGGMNSRPLMDPPINNTIAFIPGTHIPQYSESRSSTRLQTDPPTNSTSVFCSSTDGPQFGDGGLSVKLVDPPTNSTLCVGSANYMMTDNSRAAVAFLALNGARIVDIEVFSLHGPSNRTGEPTNAPGCSKSEPRSINPDVLSFGIAIADCMAREQHMLNMAEAELARAEVALEAASKAFEAIYGPYVASGTEDPVVELNVRGEIFTTLVSTLQACPDSALATRFHKERWSPSEKDVDSQGRHLVDCDPLCFSRILDVLRMRKRHAWTLMARSTQGDTGVVAEGMDDEKPGFVSAPKSRRNPWTSTAQSSQGDTGLVQDGIGDDYLGFVAVPKSHRETFGTLVNMYFPGCESFINELVEYETPASKLDPR